MVSVAVGEPQEAVVAVGQGVGRDPRRDRLGRRGLLAVLGFARRPVGRRRRPVASGDDARDLSGRSHVELNPLLSCREKGKKSFLKGLSRRR